MTVVAVLAWISGALDIVGGVLLLLLAAVPSVSDDFGGAGPTIGAGIGSIILGLIVVIVAGGLLGGNTAARLIVTVVQVFSLIGGLFFAVAWYGNRPEAITEWIGVAVSIAILLLLWTRKASAFFND
ncbi:hypothetical protein ACDF64_02190 [Agromyces sp. MMS24-JH15]|uniref:hypothetical protein n=1 Tax=Agromyces sp. MMS24-JH15 TaxID=3243765 RepID=UPI003749F56A